MPRKTLMFMKKSALFFFSLLLLGFATIQAQTTQTILSPNQKLKLKVDLGGEIIRYSISCENGEFLKSSSIWM